jgi:O-antigen ligase
MTEGAKKWLAGPARPTNPGLVTVVIFILLFSGPPMFRIRNPQESLEGTIDYVVIFRLLVEIAGALWVLYQWRKRCREGKGTGYLPFKLRTPQKLGLAVIGSLSLAIAVSAAPSLSAFKICEMLVSFSFTAMFIEIYGIKECLDKIFLASTLMCLVITACLLVAPDLVLFTSETGAPRLRGELIAPTEIVAVFALILLVGRAHKQSGLWFLLFLAFFGILVAFSLSRTAYVILAIFLALYLWKWKKRMYTYSAAAILLIMFLFDLVPSLNSYRDAGSVSTLSDRFGLWAYLTGITLQKSPWIGLGYYSASRIYGPEYNEGLGTAHSMFFEAFVGGGLLGLAALVLLCFVLGIYAIRLLRHRYSQTTFTVSMLFVATLLFGSIGGDFGYGPLGITFWSLSAMVPILHEYIRPSRASVMKGVTLSSPSPAR